MNKIDEILDRLQGAQPSIDCPDEFTDMIMDALPERDAAPKVSDNKHNIIKLARIILSAAAVLIVGLFLYTNFQEIDSPTPITNYHTSDFSYGDYLKKVYTNRQNKVKINYLQLKKTYHENF